MKLSKNRHNVNLYPKPFIWWITKPLLAVLFLSLSCLFVVQLRTRKDGRRDVGRSENLRGGGQVVIWLAYVIVYLFLIKRRLTDLLKFGGRPPCPHGSDGPEQATWPCQIGTRCHDMIIWERAELWTRLLLPVLTTSQQSFVSLVLNRSSLMSLV